MANPSRTVVERQVRRVRRRLLGGSVLHSLALAWSAGLLASCLWFLVRPFLFAGTDDVWRWAVPAALLGVATLGGLILGIVRTPSPISAALALDERFGLKERVTTLLTLPPAQADTPAGQALLQDVSTRVSGLPVASRFPITLPWQAGAAPVAALALALAAFFFEPMLGELRLGTLTAAPTKQPVNTKEIEKQLEKLRQASLQPKNPELEKSKEFQELAAEWDKMLKDPLDLKNEEKVRDRVNEMRTLEQKMKDRIDDLKAQAQKGDHLKRLLEKLSREGDKRLKDGLAKDFEDALAKGDFRKAKDALDKLAKELRDNKMTKEKQKELADQFKEVQEKMKRIMEKDEAMKQLKKDFAEGKIDKEQLDREMDRFKELQELSNLLGECKECLGLEAGEAAEKMGQLARQFEEMELTDQELAEWVAQQAALQEAMEAMLDALGDDEFQEGENGMGGKGPPGRRRPISPDDPDSKIVPERSKTVVDPRSQQRIVGYTKGGNFTRIPAKQVEGAFRQATQDAPEVIERQRIPDEAADIARGYFRKLGNQK